MPRLNGLLAAPTVKTLPRLRPAALLIGWALLHAFVVWGAPQVPFHPDESTYIYMNRDFDLLFRQGNPAAVTWQTPNEPANIIRFDRRPVATAG
jgi:hypothetical protein